MNLENMTKIYARGDSRIQLKVIPGHFVTSQSHITHYLDLTTMKSRTAEAQNIAHELAANYEVSTPVDTIICMDGLEVIGAYLSEELTKAGIFSLNAHQTIFSRVDSVASLPVYSIFNTKDIPDYHSYSSTKCPMCQRQQKIDAIVSSYGYSAL